LPVFRARKAPLRVPDRIFASVRLRLARENPVQQHFSDGH